MPPPHAVHGMDDPRHPSIREHIKQICITGLSRYHRLFIPLLPGQGAFVVTLGRAGEDNKSFQLKDLDSTFQGFAGADYNLQVCVCPEP